MSSKTRALAILLSGFLAACSDNTGGGGGGGGGDMAAGGGGGGGGDMAVGPSADLAGVGPGTVIGTPPNGGPFGDVKTAWMIGVPDSNTTEVVFMFNKAVTCHDATVMFGAMGWDQKLPSGTQFLEIKVFGPQVATPASPPIMKRSYTVTSSLSPVEGEASVNHSLTAGPAASNETPTTGNTVVVTDIVDKTSMAGTFDLNFGGGKTLTGTFNAGYCDIGVEP